MLDSRQVVFEWRRKAVDVGVPAVRLRRLEGDHGEFAITAASVGRMGSLATDTRFGDQARPSCVCR
jgi:hypothetical protein